MDGTRKDDPAVLEGAARDAEIQRQALVFPEYGPEEEHVPWGERLAPEAGRRAAELHSAEQQIAVDGLAREL